MSIRLRRPIFVAVLAVVTALAWDAPAWAISTTWTPQAVTTPAGSAAYYVWGQTVCLTTSSCFGVGGAGNGQGNETAEMEHWSGRSWSPVALPARASSFLSGIACITATNCWTAGEKAVGSGATTTSGPWAGVFMHFNGHNWALSSFAPANAGFNGVACPSSTECFATGGGHLTSNGHGSPVIARWNGHAWSLMDVPAPSGQAYAQVDSIACRSISWCVAIGSAQTVAHGANHLFGERFNGTSWSLFGFPTPRGLVNDFPNGIQCPSANLCLAVGQAQSAANSAPEAFAERWNGRAWAEVALSTTFRAGMAGMNDLSCRSATVCWTVGYGVTRGVDHASAAYWNGSTFVLGHQSSATNASMLESVRCTSANCVSLGQRFTSTSARAAAVVVVG